MSRFLIFFLRSQGLPNKGSHLISIGSGGISSLHTEPELHTDIHCFNIVRLDVQYILPDRNLFLPAFCLFRNDLFLSA